MTDETGYDRPLPTPDPDDAPFWEGCRRHELLIQRCKNCGVLRFWDRPMCANCQSMESEPVKSSGRGKLWSYTTTHQVANRAWNRVAKDQPYVVAVVDLDEGPRLTSNLATDDGELLADTGQFDIGDRVEVVFVDVTDEITLPRFRLAT